MPTAMTHEGFVETGPEQEIQSNPLEDYFEVSQEDRLRLAAEMNEYFLYYTHKLETPYTNFTRWKKLWLNQVRDQRLSTEKWRAFCPVPRPKSVVETLSAQFSEMILNTTPIIKAQAVSDKNRLPAQSIERLFDYCMRQTNFSSKLVRCIGNSIVQGVSVAKNVYISKNLTTFSMPTDDDHRVFKESLARAVEANVEIPNLSDEEEFESWRVSANEVMGLGIPAMPKMGRHVIKGYEGPSFQETSISDLFFNPEASSPDDASQLPVIIQRSVKPRSWVLDRTGPDKLYDPESVAAGLRGTPDQQISRWDRDINAVFGITNDPEVDPYLKDAVEIWECFCPGLRSKPYRVILNRSIAINNSFENIYSVPHPFIFMRMNTGASGNMLGASEFLWTERLYYYLNTLKSLTLDNLMLSVIPAFVKSRDGGRMSQRESFIRPGKVFESNNPAAFKQLISSGVDPSVLHQMDSVKQDIDECSASLPVLRGQVAQARVPTGNQEAAQQQAFVRLKHKVIEFEGELNPYILNSLAMMYSMWSAEKTIRVGGDPRLHPFVTYNKEDFLNAMQQDFRFQGARQQYDEQAIISQMKELMAIFGGLGPELLPDWKPSAHAKLIAQHVMKDASEQIFMTEEEQKEAAEMEAQAVEAQQAQQGEEEEPGVEQGAEGGQ